MEANNILVKSSPPELRNLNSSAQPVAPPQPVAPAVQTIFNYRTTGISINTEDYASLDEEQFINDAIIDFYLEFLLQEMATPQFRATTHIFSTFFYKRLTQKPTRKVQGSIENDPSVSTAKKRHSRVQSWTKNINVFEKDYIVVPINSNAHWFLAIICFPGLSGCETIDGRAVEECQRFKSVRKWKKMKLDELQRTGDSQRAQSPLRDYEGPVRHPCILIFDSLPQAGNSRVRVVATLRDWLAIEYQVKHNGATRDFSKNVFIGAKPKVPMQTKYYDCGLYLLQYAERFFLTPFWDYRLPILLENWFSAHDTNRKRYDLQHLLFIMMERLGVDKNSLNLPILHLNDPDYKSPEHEAESPDMLEAKYHAIIEIINNRQ